MLRAIKERALARGVAASVIIREALAKYLEDPGMTNQEWKREKAELLKLCGIARSRGKVSTGSTDIDDVLYGPRLHRPRK